MHRQEPNSAYQHLLITGGPQALACHDAPMCGKCDELEGKIARYTRLLTYIGDQIAQDGITGLIEKMKAEKVALHPPRKSKAASGVAASRFTLADGTEERSSPPAVGSASGCLRLGPKHRGKVILGLRESLLPGAAFCQPGPVHVGGCPISLTIERCGARNTRSGSVSFSN